ncbi:MAG: hypothetical protein K0R34_1012 [Herbinix sp.]|jgi:hypothetical protein|nr:hypothetical protein [Herbinix sp.]
MYNSKASIGRLSEFAKSTKNILLYGTQSTMSKPNLIIPVLGEQKVAGKSMPKVEVTVSTPVMKGKNQESDVLTQNDLQQAIIWSEILGKPVSKRRERRYYGN